MIWRCLNCYNTWNAPDIDGNIACPMCGGVKTYKDCPSCDGKEFEIRDRIIHLPESDAVINIRMTTTDCITHQEFVAGIEQLLKELENPYKKDD